VKDEEPQIETKGALKAAGLQHFCGHFATLRTGVNTYIHEDTNRK
jgi:hypothetical protein